MHAGWHGSPDADELATWPGVCTLLVSFYRMRPIVIVSATRTEERRRGYSNRALASTKSPEQTLREESANLKASVAPTHALSAATLVTMATVDITQSVVLASKSTTSSVKEWATSMTASSSIRNRNRRPLDPGRLLRAKS